MSEETNEPGGSRGEEAGENKQGRSRRRRRRRSKGNPDGSAQQAQGQRDSGSSNQGSSNQGSSNQGSSNQGSSKRQRSRSRRKTRKSSGHSPGNGQPQKQKRKLKTPESKFGGREPRAAGDLEEPRGPREMTPFELFCAYHLGIAEDNRYRQQNVREVARRFGCSAHELEQALKRFGLDKDTIKKAGYDISLAQLDMQVAPDGVDKRELAKVLFSDFLDMTPQVAGIIEAAMAQSSAEASVEEN